MEDSKDILELEENGTFLLSCDEEAVEVVIPEGVEEIGRHAFYDCNMIEKVYIPSSVYIIWDEAFYNCDIREFVVDKDNSHYLSEDGVLYSKDKEYIIAYPAKRKERTFNIPDGVRWISDHAFFYCTNLETVNIPRSVETIDKGAFRDCM